MRKSILVVVSLTTFFFASSYAQEECEITDALPVGLANQGGYTFHYQSGKGENCRGYLLWNAPGSVLTPVLWRDDQETFLKTNLPRRSVDSTFSPAESIHISARSVVIGETTLSYGVNMDEYEDRPDAYRRAPMQVTRFAPYTTVMRGVVADVHENPIEIAIQVSSYVNGANPYRLTYVMALVGPSIGFQILHPEEYPAESLVPALIWEAAASTPFFEYLDERGIEGLSAEVGSIVVNIEASEVELDESNLLVLAQGTWCIAATTAPAYRPVE